MKHEYSTKGVCSKKIRFSLDSDDIVTDVVFEGGCPGNSLGLSSLVEGLPREEVILRLKGKPCGKKSTSCPDQLATALENV